MLILNISKKKKKKNKFWISKVLRGWILLHCDIISYMDMCTVDFLSNLGQLLHRDVNTMIIKNYSIVRSLSIAEKSFNK